MFFTCRGHSYLNLPGVAMNWYWFIICSGSEKPTAEGSGQRQVSIGTGSEPAATRLELEL